MRHHTSRRILNAFAIQINAPAHDAHMPWDMFQLPVSSEDMPPVAVSLSSFCISLEVNWASAGLCTQRHFVAFLEINLAMETRQKTRTVSPSRNRIHIQSVLQDALSPKPDNEDDTVTDPRNIFPHHADEFSVQRLGLSEVRIMGLHCKSMAFTKGYDLTLTQRTTAVITAIPDQGDFIAADGNLFAQRNLKNSSHSDYLTSTLVEKVDAAVTYWNVMPQHYNNHVTYQVVSSTAAEGWLKAQKGEDYDADCILLVSLCYGKQTVIQSERRLKGQKMTATEKGSPIVREDEYIINDQERPKHLIRQDLGLTLTDKDWHKPLLCTIRLRPLKNNRQRSGATAERRKSEARNYFQYIGQKEDTTQHRQRYTQGQLPPDNGM